MVYRYGRLSYGTNRVVQECIYRIDLCNDYNDVSKVIYKYILLEVCHLGLTTAAMMP